MEEGRLKAGETVLVQGTGGVSVFACQLAKSMGAKVIATSSSDEKLEKMKSLGADILINYNKIPVWGKEVLKVTDGVGVDHVVEVGGAGTFGESVRACKLGGHIALIGVLGGASVSEILLPRVFAKMIRMSGISMGNKASQQAMIDFLDTVSFRPVISHQFSLSRLGDAFQHQIDNKHIGKIAIIVDAQKAAISKM